MIDRLATFLRMIKFSHSVFALPFAMVGMMLAAGGWPKFTQFFWIIVCCVSARTAAMAFNRVADLQFDRLNPRTRNRELVRGDISTGAVAAAIIVSSAIFVLGAAMLNRLAFLLSPVALAILLFYSFTKRFTAASHLFLGLALGIAPIGAWIAISGSLAWTPIILGLGVLLWTAGFDTIYACQDEDFDRRTGLHSLPARFGIPAALRLAIVFHLLSLACFAALFWTAGLGAAYLAGVAVIAWLLVYEHSIVSPTDLSRVNVAFFTINGYVSLIFFVCALADILLFQ